MAIKRLCVCFVVSLVCVTFNSLSSISNNNSNNNIGIQIIHARNDLMDFIFVCFIFYTLLTVSQKSILCQTESSGLSLTCPEGHGLDALSALAYRRLSVTDCPSNLVDNSCAYTESNASLTAQLQPCTGNRTCSNIRLRETFTPDSCWEKGFSGKFYYVVSYTCRPYHKYIASSIDGSFIGMNEDTTVSDAIVNINSISSAPTGNFVKNINTVCYVLLPSGASLFVDTKIFQQRPKQDSCDQSVEIQDEDKIYIVCSQQNTPLSIPCKQRDYEFIIKYSTTNLNVSVLFEIQLKVPSDYLLNVTCGIAVRETSDGSTTIKAETGPFIVTEYRLRGLAVLCIIAAIVIIVIIIITTLIRRRRRAFQQYNVYQYNNRKEEENTPEPAFVIESDKKILVDGATGTHYSGVF